MSKNSVFIGVGYLLIIFVIFLIRGGVFLDPDFGWHLKMGELITESGIPSNDPFSYTMKSFPFIDHEWLSNLIIYPTYKVVGYAGLAVVLTIVGLVTMVILAMTSSKSVNVKKVIFEELLIKNIDGKPLGPNFFVLLSLAVVLPFFGVRAQVMSWFLLSILAFIIFREGVWAKARFIVPIIVLGWSNLHGSFAISVGVVASFIFIRSLRTKKIDFTDLFIFLLSLLATVINPYGIRLWYEVWMQASDGTLRWNIIEWMPSIFMLDIAYVSLLAFSTFLIFKYRKKFRAEYLFIYLAFLIQALFSRRHVPLWVVISYPMTIKILYFFYDEIKNIKGAIIKFQQIYRYTWFLALLIFIVQSFMSLKSAFSLKEEAFYPKEAITFLRENSTSGEVFSEYAWGGYLIWKLPETKVFIDGRMPSWRWKDNPSGESSSAFEEYAGIVDGKKDYKGSFDKYKINTVLWPKEQRGELLDVLAKKVNALLTKREKEEVFDLLQELEKDGWQLMYEDRVAVIYQKGD